MKTEEKRPAKIIRFRPGSTGVCEAQRLLPHPFSAAGRKAGYRYQVSILQAEFSLTQVPDRPVTGRVFFEEVIRENPDIGRPGQVQLIFDRRVTARTPGRFRTRVITDRVVPSLHVDYKNTRIKQASQGGARAPYRNHHQQHTRLRHRQTVEEPALTQAGRLSGQPASSRRPARFP